MAALDVYVLNASLVPFVLFGMEAWRKVMPAKVNAEGLTRKTSPTARSATCNWMWELLLTCFSLGLLIVVAGPLADGERPLGLDKRYVLNSVARPTAATETLLPIAGTLPDHAGPLATAFEFAPAASNKAQRAQWLNRHAGECLAILALSGWICLNIGRRISNLGLKLPLIVTCWCMSAHLLGTYDARWPELFPTGSIELRFDLNALWMSAGCASLLTALWKVWRSKLMSRSPVQFKHNAASPWVYPGFVLFSGFGWLWLLDWAARGHSDKQFVGIYQADSLWLAYAVFTLVATHQGQMLAALSRFAARLDRMGATGTSLPNVLLQIMLLMWVLLLVAAAHIDSGSRGYQRHAALLCELMRVPIWVALGWVLYRWAEIGRTARALVAVSVLLAVLTAGLYLDHDGGPILAQTIATVWISCGLLQAVLARGLGRILSWSASTAIAVLGTAASIWLAFLNAPKDRVEAMKIDFQGPLDFLSMTRWLLDAAPVFGYGIGKTPWCGYEHAAGLTGQCRRAGVPDQIQSDYVVSAMLALWGWLSTILLLAGLLLWLWNLARKGPTRQTKAFDTGLLRQWIVMGFAVTSGVQVAISVAGTLGRIPLTGLAIPMLSLGGTGLVCTALFAGLSANYATIKIGAVTANPASSAWPRYLRHPVRSQKTRAT